MSLLFLTEMNAFCSENRMKSLLKFCALLMTGTLVGCTKTDKKEPEPKEPPTVSIRGAVFIATKSGNAVKLPLVRVCAVPADTYNKQLSQHSDSFLSGFKKILKEREEELEELKDFSEKNRDAFEILTEASQIWGELQTLEKKDGNPGLTSIGKGIALFTASRKISIRKHESVTEGQELLSALNSRIEKLNRLRSDHRETWERFSDWWQNLHLLMAVTGGQTTDKDSSKRPISPGSGSLVLPELEDREAVFGALLKKQFKIESRSDADGKFSMNLDPDLDYVLVATAKRLVGEETEKYYWAWPAKGSELSPDREIFLSNSELISRNFNLLDLNPEDPDRRGKLAIRIGAALEEMEGIKKFKIQYSGGGLAPRDRQPRLGTS